MWIFSLGTPRSPATSTAWCRATPVCTSTSGRRAARFNSGNWTPRDRFPPAPVAKSALTLRDWQDDETPRHSHNHEGRGYFVRGTARVLGATCTLVLCGV